MPKTLLKSTPAPNKPGTDHIQLRTAVSDDLDALVAIENEAFDADRISRRSFRYLLSRQTAEIIVADLDGAICGYAMILFRNGTSLARLYSIAVGSQARGKGFAKRLLEAAEQRAFSHDRVILRLEVREDNAPAIALYKAHGYRAIGRYADYYEDHSDALRFEKLLRGGVPLESPVPFYEQTADFTCGAACLMMALAANGQDISLDPVTEISLWRQATTVFMLSGPGGCEPFGLAVTAREHGLKARIVCSQEGPLFLDTVRDKEKRRVMELAQTDFRRRAAQNGLQAEIRDFDMDELRGELARGNFAIVLMSSYMMFHKKIPHWILAHGDDGRHIMIHDPWVEDERGETVTDAANLPIPYAIFDRMARYGKSGLRAAIFITRE
jgi:ribosomal-protein-alanine acetyltransferase